jgi:hypothetical protein
VARHGDRRLSAALARLQADLLVMGAYGHSRLREFLLGGVTRYFLEQRRADLVAGKLIPYGLNGSKFPYWIYFPDYAGFSLTGK